MPTYPDVQLFIGGQWKPGITGETISIENPATGEKLSDLSRATAKDLDEALLCAEKAFDVWKNASAFDRSKLMRNAAAILRERADHIAWLMSSEQGKPIAEAKAETLAGADIIEWFAEEARRTYGRIIPARANNVTQLAVKEPVGVVAAFAPWNFPINQAVRKISAALAAGCSIILKGPEETPASCAELVRAYADAGIPAGVGGKTK